MGGSGGQANCDVREARFCIHCRANVRDQGMSREREELMQERGRSGNKNCMRGCGMWAVDLF